TTKRLIYLLNNELDRVEEGVIDPLPRTYDLRLRQIETARSLTDQIRRSFEFSSYKTEQLDRALSDIISRLEAVRE
ncbi:MAG: hypothetical protein V3W02_02205, partial [Gammaproteobacteria bacterium]